MDILLITSAQKNSNTDKLNQEFIHLAQNNGNKVTVIDALTIGHCIGCKMCAKYKKCIKNDDALTDFISEHPSIVVFSGAIYFFGLNSALATALNRINDTTNKVIFGLILCSGSYGIESGIDLIIEQFRRIDTYGSFTVPVFNKVTYDKRTPVNECDILGLKKLLEDLKEAYNEIT